MIRKRGLGLTTIIKPTQRNAEESNIEWIYYGSESNILSNYTLLNYLDILRLIIHGFTS